MTALQPDDIVLEIASIAFDKSLDPEVRLKALDRMARIKGLIDPLDNSPHVVNNINVDAEQQQVVILLPDNDPEQGQYEGPNRGRDCQTERTAAMIERVSPRKPKWEDVRRWVYRALPRSLQKEQYENCEWITWRQENGANPGLPWLTLHRERRQGLCQHQWDLQWVHCGRGVRCNVPGQSIRAPVQAARPCRHSIGGRHGLRHRPFPRGSRGDRGRGLWSRTSTRRPSKSTRMRPRKSTVSYPTCS